MILSDLPPIFPLPPIFTADLPPISALPPIFTADFLLAGGKVNVKRHFHTVGLKLFSNYRSFAAILVPDLVNVRYSAAGALTNIDEILHLYCTSSACIIHPSHYPPKVRTAA